MVRGPECQRLARGIQRIQPAVILPSQVECHELQLDARESSAKRLTKRLRPRRVHRCEANVALLGPLRVGKTEIANHLGQSFYADCEVKPEITELYQADVRFEDAEAKHHHRLSILDTIGTFRECFPSMYEKTIQDCDAFILVFVKGDRTSFEEVKQIYNDIITIKERETVPILLVANKREDATIDENVCNEIYAEMASTFSHSILFEYASSSHVSKVELSKSIQTLTLMLEQAL